MKSSQLVSITKSPVQIWVFRTGKISRNSSVWLRSILPCKVMPVTGYTQPDNAALWFFSAAKAKAFQVFHIGGRQGKISAGEDERNVRIFQHAYSILNNKPLQLLADLHWLQPNPGSSMQPTLYWKWSSCFGIWWSISPYASNAWRNASWQFVEILAAVHSTTFSQEVVPTV